MKMTRQQYNNNNNNNNTLHKYHHQLQYDPHLRQQIKKKQKQKQYPPSAIIPVGSLEQHGPHLPITTDTDIVTAVANLLSHNLRAFLFPTIPYGVSTEHAPLFQLSVTKSTLQKQITDLCTSLAQDNHIYNIFIINGHHGNIPALTSIPTFFTNKNLNVHVFSYWHFMSQKFDHAGFIETSLMLSISKNVKMNLAIKGFDENDITNQKELEKIKKIAATSFPTVTKNGVWGDPTIASKKAGDIILDEIIKNLSKKCKNCLVHR